MLDKKKQSSIYEGSNKFLHLQPARKTMGKITIESKIFACTQTQALGKEIAKQYGISMGNVLFTRYSDGEYQPSFEESIRGSRIFIIGSTNPTSDNLMEMLLMLDLSLIHI